MLTDIKNIWTFRDMVFELTHRELRGKYKGSVLGFLWAYINPLMQILVYAFVFSQIFRSAIEKFHLYLIVSMFPFNFFTGGVMQVLVYQISYVNWLVLLFLLLLSWISDLTICTENSERKPGGAVLCSGICSYGVFADFFGRERDRLSDKTYLLWGINNGAFWI